jgi:hypothetical protein
MIIGMVYFSQKRIEALACAAFAVQSKDAVNVHNIKKMKTLKHFLDSARSSRNIQQLIIYAIFIKITLY